MDIKDKYKEVFIIQPALERYVENRIVHFIVESEFHSIYSNTINKENAPALDQY